MNTPKIPVTLEGLPFIFFFAFLTLVTAALGFPAATVVLLLFTFFVLWFFRDPERFVPSEEGVVVSPADGRVIRISEVDENRFTGERARKVSIFMNVFNVHVNRMPISGSVDKITYRPGKFYSADSPRAEMNNEYCAALIVTPGGSRIAVVQIAGLIARRIVCWLEPGDRLKTGERFGLIRFGSRVDLYLPVDAEILVNEGDRVCAGESTLASLR